MDKLPWGPLTFFIGDVWVEGLDENYVIDAGGIEVAWLIDGDLAQQKAYAELFASAPELLRQRDELLRQRDELLEVLGEISSHVNGMKGVMKAYMTDKERERFNDVLHKARAAIAAATE